MEKLAASYSDSYLSCFDKKFEELKAKKVTTNKKTNDATNKADREKTETNLSSHELSTIEDYCMKYSVQANKNSDEKDLTDYFSTHPAFSERIQRFKDSQ